MNFDCESASLDWTWQMVRKALKCAYNNAFTVFKCYLSRTNHIGSVRTDLTSEEVELGGHFLKFRLCNLFIRIFAV